MYAAIDLTVAKLEGQIRKNKTKMRKKFKDIMQYELLMQEEEPENTSDIVKRKTIELKPMDEEEAILQMELLGHDFYIFKNVKVVPYLFYIDVETVLTESLKNKNKIMKVAFNRLLFFRYTNKKSKIHEMCRIMIETLKKSLKNKQKFAYFLKHMIEL